MAQLLSETRMIRYKKKHTHISPNKKSQSGLSIEKKHNKQTTKKNKVLTNPEVFHKKKNSPVIEKFHLPPGRRPRIRIRPEIPLVSKLFTCVFTKAKNLHPSIQGNGEKTKTPKSDFWIPHKIGALMCFVYIYIHIKDVFFPFPKRKVF